MKGTIVDVFPDGENEFRGFIRDVGKNGMVSVINLDTGVCSWHHMEDECEIIIQNIFEYPHPETGLMQ